MKKVTTLDQFVDQLDGFSKWDGKDQIDHFAYFLIKEEEQESFTATEILSCFDRLSLKRYARTAAYLSESSKSKSGRYVKRQSGYRLERSAFDTIRERVEHEPRRVQVSQQLTDLIDRIKDSQEKSFLVEAINCYRVEAYRATIVLTWIMTVDHLQKFIFGQKLTEFNLALSKNPDKKIKQVVNYDDFSDLSESKFIELLRASNLISNDISKNT